MAERASTLRWRTYLGSFVTLGLLIAATALTIGYFTDLRTLAHVLESGHWWWIAAAIAAHVLYFLVYAILYRLGFSLVGVSSRTWSIVPVMFAGLFVNLLVPAGAGGAALFVDDAVRRGESGARATVGVVLVLLLDLVTVVPFVVWGMIFLLERRMFAPWQLLAAGAYIMYLVLLVALLVLSHARQAWVSRVLGWVYRVIHRVLGWIHVRGPAVDWPDRTAAGFADAAGAIAASPGRLLLAAVPGLVTHVLHVISLWLFVRGFGAEVPLGGLVAAFALGIVLTTIAVIPQLAPLAQAFMTATFIGVGVDAGPAVAATIAFRGLVMGLPLLLGLPFAWRIGRMYASARTLRTASPASRSRWAVRRSARCSRARRWPRC